VRKSELKRANNVMFLTFRSVKNPQKNYNTGKYITQEGWETDYSVITDGSYKLWTECPAKNRVIFDLFCITSGKAEINPTVFSRGLGRALTICKKEELSLVIVFTNKFNYNKKRFKWSAENYSKKAGVTLHLFFPAESK